MARVQSGSALSADGASGIMFALMRTSAGANYCVELVLAAEDCVASETGMTVIHQYLMEFNTIDMIREQDTFKRLVNMLAAAALDSQVCARQRHQRGSQLRFGLLYGE